tara:strand:+ start:7282 stop:8541 length:1260 start_codon:yes stop_codon:yes gene_type:complete
MIINGDCIEEMQKLIDQGVQVDAVVTDPPYHLQSIVDRFGKTSLSDDTKTSERARDRSDGYARMSAGGFMGQEWDGGDIAFRAETWRLAWELLKPGGHLLAFSASRNYHRMAVAIEDAGFEIRDQMMWLYGSGFPKSHNIGKNIDKMPNADLNAFSKALKEKRIELGYSLTEADELITGGSTMYSFLEGRRNNDVYPPNKKYWEKIKEHFGMDGWDKIIENNLKVVGEKDGNFGYQKDGKRWKNTTNETEMTSKTAKQWEGWGTALKPAHEPIAVGRKPISESTVAKNVLKHGTGAINIDASRIKSSESIEGRFPANVMHDGLQQDWARFFYCPKVSKKERGENNKHPTVKPQELMKYLVRLVTPKGGTVLDPFMGSGSTGMAAKDLGCNFIGIEKSEDYFKICQERIDETNPLSEFFD